MSLSSISSQLPRAVEQQNMERHIQSSVSSAMDCSTVCKVLAVVASVFISIGAFVLGGPITGVVVALLCAASLLSLFTGSIPSHQHGIWFLSGNPPGRGFDPHDPHGRGHVAVGRGHFRGAPVQPPTYGHAPVGGGHGHAPAVGQPHAQGHAPVGGGHHPGAGPTQVPPPSGSGGHVPVGGGRRG